MFALINKTDNKILRVGSSNTELSASKPFAWTSCPDACNTQWSYDGTIFTQPEVVALTPEEIQEQTNQEALAYLASTDWWVVRYAETGTPVDSEVATKRADARLAIK